MYSKLSANCSSAQAVGISRIAGLAWPNLLPCCSAAVLPCCHCVPPGPRVGSWGGDARYRSVGIGASLPPPPTADWPGPIDSGPVRGHVQCRVPGIAAAEATGPRKAPPLLCGQTRQRSGQDPGRVRAVAPVRPGLEMGDRVSRGGVCSSSFGRGAPGPRARARARVSVSE